MSERSHIPQPGDVLGGKYEIGGRLGQGGMGLVLSARNVRTNRRVAIKWLLPRLMDNASALKRFEREAQVAGQINHPNVVNVYDIERDGDTLYIVMELLEGQSLAERLSGGRPLPLVEAAPLFMGVLRGVAAAHAAGVVHRDLKPDNVFLCQPRDGSAEIPKVLDFGISKLSKRENVSTITEEGSLLGTVQYMSPEQLRGQDTDERTDVYALGVILYRMLTAQMPFPGANHIDLVLNMASHPARALGEFLPDVAEGLERAVAFALERNADQRLAGVEQFAHALEPYFGGHTFRIGDPPSGSWRPGPSSHASARPAPERVSEHGEQATPFAAEDRPVSQVQPPAPKETPAWLHRLALRIGIAICIAIPGTFGYLHWREAQESLAPLRALQKREPPPPPAAPTPATREFNQRHSAERKADDRAVETPWARPQADAGVAEPPVREAQRQTATPRRTRPARPVAAPPEPERQPEIEAPPPNAPKARPYRAGKPDRNEF